MSTGNRAICWLVLATLFSIVGVTETFAQRGRGFGFGPNRAQLATLKEVQAALNLSEEQIKVGIAATGEFNREVSELFRMAAGDVEKVRAAMPSLHEKATKQINEKLDETQRKRLTEIFIQQNGVNSVFDPQVRSILNLTDEQMAALQIARKTNREEGAKETRAMPKGETREERSARFEQLWKNAEDRILTVLTPQQKTSFETLRGEELEVDMRPLFPPPPPKKNDRRFAS